MLDPTYIIKKPLVTEKSTWGMNENRQYCFLVDRAASKKEIGMAVESIYKVSVEQVQTQVRKGKLRRLKYGWVMEPETKKATVKLKEGQTIDLF